MPLSWNEIKSRAFAFSREWSDAANEDSEAKPFLIAFFEVFGITNKRVASFEHAVKKHGGGQGFVDLFWPGILLVEMKSRGKNLDRAFDQAMDYFPGIKERDLPRHVLVCDFARFALTDLETGQTLEFKLADLHKHVRLFGFIAGYSTLVIQPQNPINIKAAEAMGRLHDRMKAVGYQGRPLEIYLVRLLFCLFSEDTGIFEKRQFQDYIEAHTAEDGGDLGHHLASLFYLLNTPHPQRLTNLESDVLPPERASYVLGNPPFVGAKYMNEGQRQDTRAVFAGIENAGLLDFVAAWYVKAARYVAENPATRCAFVSTNSITQGEQVGVLWGWLLSQGIRIHFAHRTFSWNNEARGKAAVHCVIIGFGRQDVPEKTLFEYEDIRGEAHAVKAGNINPYLVDAPDVVLPRRSRPICPVPEIGIGNKPIDGGNYLFTPEEKVKFLAKEPAAAPYFRRWIGADEFINGFERWCLWLGDCPPATLRALPESLKRVQAVKTLRENSKSPPTQKLAATPTRFHVENMPDSQYLVIPEVSSERRVYIPIGYLPPEVFASNKVRLLPNATLFQFGVLASAMHMAWTRATCGRLESRYQYSVSIVYNNFPWPDAAAAVGCAVRTTPGMIRDSANGAHGAPYNAIASSVGQVSTGNLTPTDGHCRLALQPDLRLRRNGANDKHRAAIEAAAQGVLDARVAHPGATLADLYDPLTMPGNLLKAHQLLDKAVDAAYGYQGGKDGKGGPFTDACRVAFLFTRYQQLTSLLPSASAKPPKNRRSGYEVT